MSFSSDLEEKKTWEEYAKNIRDSSPQSPTSAPGMTASENDFKEHHFWDEQAKIRNDGLKEFYVLRQRWSKTIRIWISMLIAFNILLTACVGWGWLNYTHYKWFITSVTVETFLQIVGMGYVAVKFLFSKGEEKC